MVALRLLWKITEGEKCSDFWRADHIVQASSNVHQAWAGTQNTDHCRDGWVHLVQVEETRHRLQARGLRPFRIIHDSQIKKNQDPGLCRAPLTDTVRGVRFGKG